MLKKSDILPLILAAISTALIVGLGYWWLTKINTTKIDGKSEVTNNNAADDAATQAKHNSQLTTTTASDPQEVFVMPAIVPEGTAVSINGSSKMARINQALSKSFHRQFPRTAIQTDADGNIQGIKLLTSSAIDIAAIDRPLSDQEKLAGLREIQIRPHNPTNQEGKTPKLYYAYRQPATAEVSAFLGFVLSSQGQEIVNQSIN